MRPAWSVLPCAAAFLLACSEPDTKAIPVEVQWMEWPAEVLAATPFTVRLSGYGPGCYLQSELHVPIDADVSAVTFAPYWLVEPRSNVICYARDGWLTAQRLGPIDVGFYDTRAAVPGLAATTPRSYEIRGAASVFAPATLDRIAALPIRTFGDVIVRSDSADPSRVNAGGQAYGYRDTQGCVWIQPFFIFPGYVVENPPDTAAYWTGFLRGYLYSPQAPVCGETRVFHVTTFN